MKKFKIFFLFIFIVGQINFVLKFIGGEMLYSQPPEIESDIFENENSDLQMSDSRNDNSKNNSAKENPSANNDSNSNDAEDDQEDLLGLAEGFSLINAMDFYFLNADNILYSQLYHELPEEPPKV